MSFSGCPFLKPCLGLAFLSLALGAAAQSSPAVEKKPDLNQTFEDEPLGPVGKGYLITDGVFEIAACGEKNQALAVLAEPLVNSGVQLGESLKMGALTVEARILGSKKGRIMPQFGLGVHGQSGYQVRVSPALKKIELVRGEAVLAEAHFVWASDQWCHVQLQIMEDKDGYVFQGNVWMEGQVAPATPLLSKKEPLTFKGQGRLTLYATPYAGTPVFFDDVKLALANANAKPSPAP